MSYKPLVNPVDDLSSVNCTIMSMSKEELEEVRKELLKNTKIIKTKFGDIVLIEHLIFKEEK
jgi:hypothetical protein